MIFTKLKLNNFKSHQNTSIDLNNIVNYRRAKMNL